MLQITHVPVGFWRSVGHSINAFVFESMLDEVAHAAGRDPYALRRELLADHPRELALLDLVAEKAGWAARWRGSKGPARPRHRAARVRSARWSRRWPRSRCRTALVQVDRIVCAVDPGLVVNPDTIDGQMRSGIIWSIRRAATKDHDREGPGGRGELRQLPARRDDGCPCDRVHIAPSGEAAGGIGEPATPPVAPAVGNAIFAATGKRIRTLPSARST